MQDDSDPGVPNSAPPGAKAASIGGVGPKAAHAAILGAPTDVVLSAVERAHAAQATGTAGRALTRVQPPVRQGPRIASGSKCDLLAREEGRAELDAGWALARVDMGVKMNTN